LGRVEGNDPWYVRVEGGNIWNIKEISRVLVPFRAYREGKIREQLLLTSMKRGGEYFVKGKIQGQVLLTPMKRCGGNNTGAGLADP